MITKICNRKGKFNLHLSKKIDDYINIILIIFYCRLLTFSVLSIIVKVIDFILSKLEYSILASLNMGKINR